MIEQKGFRLLRENVIQPGLCFECGACELVCPKQAIMLKKYSFGRVPELISDCSCGDCDLCYRACAGREVPLTAIEQKYFGRTRNHCFPGKTLDLPDTNCESETGIYKHVYSGYAKSTEVHDASVSGGAATSILISALEKGMIDGAVLAGFDPETPYEAKAVAVTTKEEILACAGSKYQPHPQLLGLRDAMKKGLKKIAITGTPCTILSLRKMMLQEEFAEITDRIVLVMSNICGAHWSRHGTEHLIRNCAGVELDDVAKLKYRARPFPGDFLITKKDGSEVRNPFVNSFIMQLARFTPEECRYCLEKVASCADIVFGDTWHHPVLSPDLLMGYTEEDEAKDERIALAKRGMTMIVTRNENGENFLRNAVNSDMLHVFQDTDEDAKAFLCSVHRLGKPVCNGPVIQSRIVRNQPLREYF